MNASIFLENAGLTYAQGSVIFGSFLVKTSTVKVASHQLQALSDITIEDLLVLFRHSDDGGLDYYEVQEDHSR